MMMFLFGLLLGLLVVPVRNSILYLWATRNDVVVELSRERRAMMMRDDA